MSQSDVNPELEIEQEENLSASVKHSRLIEPIRESDLGLEARVREDHHLDTRLWLRLLACSTQIEREVSELLRQHFSMSLSRFDYLAQLERCPEGLRMSVLSQRLMVTGGNVTGLTRELIRDGLVSRTSDPDDGRAWRIRLTAKGIKLFARMAKAHEAWLSSLLEGVPLSCKELLYDNLRHLRAQLGRNAKHVKATAQKHLNTPKQTTSRRQSEP